MLVDERFCPPGDALVAGGIRETPPVIEAHGTGTALGDPTEVRAILQVRSRSIVTYIDCNGAHLQDSNSILIAMARTCRIVTAY